MLLSIALNIFCAIATCYPPNPPLKIHNEIQGRSLGRLEPLDPLDTNVPPLANTETGWVEGYYQKTITGRDIAAFEGIPYGESTAGEGRFRKPRPAASWRGILSAKKKGPQCLQCDIKFLNRPNGSEKCLYLNVYTPALSIKKNQTGLPVFAYIHGGGYMWLEGSGFGPAYLLKRDVILVTMNFRLGILGFLSTGDDYASGNWGLKDQNLALKWISKNIGYFGGDPRRVTITGVSSGSACAALHTISPRSKGLIQKAILEGGTALDHFAIIHDTFNSSKIIARKSGCPQDDSKAMIECLRTRDGNWLVAQITNTWKIPFPFILSFGPVIEPPTAEEPFLLKHPRDSYLEGEVEPIPIIFGINRDEGGIFSAIMYIMPLLVPRFNRHFNKFAPHVMVFENGEVPDTVETSKKIRQFYLKGKNMDWYNRAEWIKMLGDRFTYVGNYHAIQFHSRVGPTYGYFFSYDGSSLIKLLGLNNKEWGGVSHGDTMIYLYNSSTFPPMLYGSADYKISELMTNIWSNFAESGVPYYTDEQTGEKMELWDPVQDPYNVRLFEINQNPKMIPIPYKNRIDFWDEIRTTNLLPFEEPYKSRSNFSNNSAGHNNQI